MVKVFIKFFSDYIKKLLNPSVIDKHEIIIKPTILKFILGRVRNKSVIWYTPQKINNKFIIIVIFISGKLLA